jgi:nanoRNase/pAp phosphatase (c-di-AMP/oligoRNAs hydrolase)
MNIQQQIKEQLEQAQTIAIFGHQSIDGDALGAMFGL